MPVLIDKKQDAFVEYDVSYIDPKSFGAMNNPLAKKIIESLAVSPMCAIDIARKLEIQEHKVYYHLSKLQRAGIVKLVGTEKRYGMVAQLYDLVSPVVAAKLHENGKTVGKRKTDDKSFLEFMHPFIHDGKFDAKIIVGDPHPHGKYNYFGKSATDIFDLIMMLGAYVDKQDSNYFNVDTRVTDRDLIGNIILIGSIKENVIVDRFNDKFKYRFNEDMSITDGKIKYSDPRCGLIAKIPNPLNPSSKLLLLGGMGARGTKAGVIALTREFEKIKPFISNKDEVYIVVEGIDKDGDGTIDSVNVLG